MTSYKLNEELTAWLYHSSYFDKAEKLGPGRFKKDWAVSVCYDFNSLVSSSN